MEEVWLITGNCITISSKVQSTNKNNSFMMWGFDKSNPLKINYMDKIMMNDLDLYHHIDGNNKYQNKL